MIKLMIDLVFGRLREIICFTKKIKAGHTEIKKLKYDRLRLILILKSVYKEQ